MAVDYRTTYLCYDNSDLIRDGYIGPIIEKEYIPVSSFNVDKLNSGNDDVSYDVEYDGDGSISRVKEIKKMLPASKIQVQVDFSKTHGDGTAGVVNPGSTSFNPSVNLLINPMLSAIGIGGVSRGITNFIFQILDSETLINYPITVTEEIRESGIISLDFYPLSVFGVVKGKKVKYSDGNVGFSGLIFSEEQLFNIGRYDNRANYEGVVKRAEGATDTKGFFGGMGDPYVSFSSVAQEGQEQLFEMVLQDPRSIKFRADNLDSIDDYRHPFKLNGHLKLDATSKVMKIKNKDDNGNYILNVGDVLYATMCVAKKRHVRQDVTHAAVTVTGNPVAGMKWVGSISTDVFAWDYQVCNWVVPRTDVFDKYFSGVGEIEYLSSYPFGYYGFLIGYPEDKYYKLSLSDYIDYYMGVKGAFEKKTDVIEGWRLTSAITEKVRWFWAADYRGIFLYRSNYVEKIVMICEAKYIRDQDWFYEYLRSLPFITPSGKNGEYLASDYEKEFDRHVDFKDDDNPAYLFDISYITNCLKYDREKIAYHAYFANALKKIKPMRRDDPNSGVGVLLLDIGDVAQNQKYNILYRAPNLDQDFFVEYDLSNAVFYESKMVPRKTDNCTEGVLIDRTHYSSWNHAFGDNVPGAWPLLGNIQPDVFGWTPPDQGLNSFWSVVTPFFCGNYTRDSRIYVEKLPAGNSCLDLYSWVYADTDYLLPRGLSYDINSYNDSSLLFFKDKNIVPQGISYHRFSDVIFSNQISSSSLNKDLINEKPDFDFNRYAYLGYNRLLGDSPSFSEGKAVIKYLPDIPITMDTLVVDSLSLLLRNSELNNDIGGYNFDFKSSYTGEFLGDSFVNTYMVIYFKISDYNLGLLKESDKQVAIRFFGTGAFDTGFTISNLKITDFTRNDNGVCRFVFDMGYYYGSSCLLLGGIWEYVTIEYIAIFGEYTDKELGEKSELQNLPSKIFFGDLKINSDQMFHVYGDNGDTYLFYCNDVTGNIDVVISYDGGETWISHHNLLRLTGGEYVSLPYVLKDGQSENLLYLFYVLNNLALLVKVIDVSLFENDDAFGFKDYNIRGNKPSEYDIGSYDSFSPSPDSSEDDKVSSEKQFWGEFSDSGNLLRRSPSYFVAVDSSEKYFSRQKAISSRMLSSYNNDNTREYPRYVFSGRNEDLADEFNGYPYCIFFDGSSSWWLFYVSNGKLNMKVSFDRYSWRNVVFNVEFHKLYFGNDDLFMDYSRDISNISVCVDKEKYFSLSLFYYNNEMLFMVTIPMSDLLVEADGDALTVPNLEEKMNLDNTANRFNSYRPVFLAGNIPEEIRELLKKQAEGKLSSSDSEVNFIFPYDVDLIDKFNEDLAVDSSTQAVSQYSKDGTMRVFYRDSLGNINGIIVYGNFFARLELMTEINYGKE